MWSTSVPRFVAGALAATLAASSACAGTLQIVTRQGAREAIVLRAGPVPAPTVIVLHGATATADRTARSSGFAEAAAAHGFVAVFPQGINRQWNDGREGRTAAVDDVGFLNQLLDELVGRGIADPARIFIAGISNGGAILVRPDGFVGFRVDPADDKTMDALDAHLATYLIPSVGAS